MTETHNTQDIYRLLVTIKEDIGGLKGTLGGVQSEMTRVAMRVEQVDRDMLERHSSLGQRVAVLERKGAENHGKMVVIWAAVVAVVVAVWEGVRAMLPTILK